MINKKFIKKKPFFFLLIGYTFFLRPLLYIKGVQHLSKKMTSFKPTFLTKNKPPVFFWKKYKK